MKIAITGFRGIPANYGGFETFVEELAPRLAKKGHAVTVYCRSNNISYPGQYYKGVRLRILPTISHKYFDTVCHTFISLVHTFFHCHDVVLILNAANSPISFLPRMRGMKVVINVDGIERLRKKWNRFGKLYYRVGEFCATRFPNAIVSDAKVIEQYYLQTYNARSIMIPYGAYVGKQTSREVLAKFGLEPGGYILYVSRLEPENNADKVIRAFKQLRTDKKLVIVGDAPYAATFKNSLRECAGGDPRIVFTGFVFGNGYREFQSNAYCYVQATEVGGTHPALIEAMGFGNCVIANGTKENIEVLGDAGLIYAKNDIDDLARKLQSLLDKPETVRQFGCLAQERVRKYFSWDTVTDEYEKLFMQLLDNKSEE